MARRFEAIITAEWMLNDFVKALRIRRADDTPFKIHPGQFFMLHFTHEGRRVNRSYSVSTAIPSDKIVDEMEWCVALVDDGLGSAIIRDAKVGDTLELSGSHGRFVLRGTPEHLVLVATGTGIAPYRAMAGELAARLSTSDVRIDLVMGVRHANELLYDSEFDDLASKYPGFHYHRCISRPADPDAFAESGGIVGRVQLALERIPFSDETTEFFLCGNPSMVDDMRRLLIDDHGFERRGVHTEAYVSPPDLAQ